jgi:hypothetical protein
VRGADGGRARAGGACVAGGGPVLGGSALGDLGRAGDACKTRAR